MQQPWRGTRVQNHSSANSDQMRNVAELCPQRWPVQLCLDEALPTHAKKMIVEKKCRGLKIKTRVPVTFGCSCAQRAGVPKLTKPTADREMSPPTAPDLASSAELGGKSTEFKPRLRILVTSQQRWFVFLICVSYHEVAYARGFPKAKHNPHNPRLSFQLPRCECSYSVYE